jgi:hypothetical protein
VCGARACSLCSSVISILQGEGQGTKFRITVRSNEAAHVGLHGWKCAVAAAARRQAQPVQATSQLEDSPSPGHLPQVRGAPGKKGESKLFRELPPPPPAARAARGGAAARNRWLEK